MYPGKPTTTRKPTYSNVFIYFFFFFFFGGPWSESLLLPESELSEDEEEEEEEEDEEELSSSLSLLLSLSSEEELEESLLSDDESLEEPSASLLLSLESLALRASGGAQRKNMNTANRTARVVIKASRCSCCSVTSQRRWISGCFKNCNTCVVTILRHFCSRQPQVNNPPVIRQDWGGVKLKLNRPFVTAEILTWQTQV